MAEADPSTPPVAAPTAPPASPPPAAPPATPPVDQSLLGREGTPPPVTPPAGGLPDWMADFPDTLKAEKTLEAFVGKTPADLAQALVETKKMVGDRVPIPKADDPDSLLRFAAAMRPEKADAYEVKLDEGSDPAFAEHMKPMFHEAGLQQWQVDILTKGNNEFIKGMTDSMEQAGAASIEKLKTEMGNENFEQNKQAAVALLTRLGIPASFDTDMARFMGAENSLRYFFALAKSAGELGKINSGDVQLALGQMTPEAAKIEADKMTAGTDPNMVKALRDDNSPESQRLMQLAAIIAGAQNQS
jgi:hypothetical protein